MYSFLQKILFIPLLLSGYQMMAQLKFSASVTPGSIKKDEYAQLRLIVENAKSIQDIVLPILKDFVILSGPNQESGMSMVNGDVTRYMANNYIIKPKKPGIFVIPPATAKADGTILRSAPVNLRVINATSGNNAGTSSALFSPFNGIDPTPPRPAALPYDDYVLKNGENATDKAARNIIMQLETSKKTCFVGEPIVATYKLYTRLKSESNQTKSPSFNGFSVIDLQQPDNSGYQVEKFNSRNFNVYILRKAQLYPLQAGKLQLEAAETENMVSFIKESYYKQQQNDINELFGDPFGPAIAPEGLVTQKISLKSEPVSIVVKPLPEEGRPADFKGAVGRFVIEARLTTNNFSTDEVNELKLVISGAGNLQLVTTPDINWPTGTEVFEPVVREDLNNQTIPVSGGKIISYPFSVTQPGNYVLPVIRLPYFDPSTGKYKIAAAGPFSFSVTKGSGKVSGQLSKEVPNPEKSGNEFFRNPWLILGIPAVLFLAGLSFWFKRAVKRDHKEQAGVEKVVPSSVEVAEAEIHHIPLDPLTDAAKCLRDNDSVNFYPVLNQSIKQFLSAQLNIPYEELNKKTINEHMDANGVKNELILQWQQLLDDIEWQLYTPITAGVGMPEMFEKADGLVRLLLLYKR